MAELSTSKGVTLEACADGGAEDVACRPAFAKGSRQSHIGHNSVSFVLGLVLGLFFLNNNNKRQHLLFSGNYILLCVRNENESV